MVVYATHGTVQQPASDPGRVHTGEMALAWAVVEAPGPIRALTIGVTGVGLALLAFGDRPDLAERAATRLGEPLVSDPALTGVATRQLTEYLAGDRQVFDLPLDWRLSAGSGLRVLQALYETVPYGETVTYGELAALAGHPNAQRAAGTFCAHTRLPLILPCHRVVAAGGLGSYGSLGLDYKRRLLELEHAAL